MITVDQYKNKIIEVLTESVVLQCRGERMRDPSLIERGRELLWTRLIVVLALPVEDPYEGGYPSSTLNLHGKNVHALDAAWEVVNLLPETWKCTTDDLPYTEEWRRRMDKQLLDSIRGFFGDL